MSNLTDHELTTLVEAAASGAVDSRAAHHGGPGWDALEAGDKNAVREHALPFIFHGTKALEELGFTRPRVAMTPIELDALPNESLILDAQHRCREGLTSIEGRNWWRAMGPSKVLPSAEIDLPATILHVGGAS